MSGTGRFLQGKGLSVGLLVLRTRFPVEHRSGLSPCRRHGLSTQDLKSVRCVPGLVLALGSVGCAGAAGPAQTTTEGVAISTATSGTTPSTATPTTGELEPIVVPTLPATIPGYTEVDPATGLHMTGTPQVIDLATYHLTVEGKVTRSLSLTYDDLRRMPRLTSRDVIVCRGYFEDYAHWAGCALTALLDRCEPRPGAKGLELVSADGYRSTVTLQEARSGYAFLAYEWEGKALPVLHGFPVKAAFPGLPGSKWVKWLVEIRVE